LAKTS
jgi:large subunit ribosomal protein L7e